jgi:uncharacterized protein YjiS (DUF1127 family)
MDKINLSRTLRTWRQYRNTVSELNSLSQRELSDLGISRFDIPAIAHQATR